MAVLRIPDENRTITGKTAVAEYLGKIGIDYDVWEPSRPVGAEASQQEILDAYSAEVDKLKAAGGYVTVEVRHRFFPLSCPRLIEPVVASGTLVGRTAAMRSM